MDAPEQLRRRYAQWSWSLAWNHTPQLVTWRLDGPDGQVCYLKVAPAPWSPRLADEAARMRWARTWLPVPQVVEDGTDGQTDWLVTVALPGLDATADALRADPAAMVEVLAAGLRRVHAVPAAGCPFDFRLDTALAQVRARVAVGLVDPQRDFHAEHRHLSAAAALAELDRLRPSTEDQVVCHGDFCLPNVLVTDRTVTGLVDLGRLAVADRWWDLAVAAWSVAWNLGPQWQQPFLAAYGVAPDEPRIVFYRLLYDLM